MKDVERLSKEIERHARALAERSAELAELLEEDLDVPPPGRNARRGARFEPGAAGVSEDVRLIATQMAVAGSSREEIQECLRSEHGVKDSGAVLERIGI